MLHRNWRQGEERSDSEPQTQLLFVGKASKRCTFLLSKQINSHHNTLERLNGSFEHADELISLKFQPKTRYVGIYCLKKSRRLWLNHPFSSLWHHSSLTCHVTSGLWFPMTSEWYPHELIVPWRVISDKKTFDLVGWDGHLRPQRCF